MKLAQAIEKAVPPEKTEPIYREYYTQVYEDNWISKMRKKV